MTNPRDSKEPGNDSLDLDSIHPGSETGSQEDREESRVISDCNGSVET